MDKSKDAETLAVQLDAVAGCARDPGPRNAKDSSGTGVLCHENTSELTSERQHAPIL